MDNTQKQEPKWEIYNTNPFSPTEIKIDDITMTGMSAFYKTSVHLMQHNGKNNGICVKIFFPTIIADLFKNSFADVTLGNNLVNDKAHYSIRTTKLQVKDDWNEIMIKIDAKDIRENTNKNTLLKHVVKGYEALHIKIKCSRNTFEDMSVSIPMESAQDLFKTKE